MQTITGKTVREIALEAPLSARVFEEFKIDFCCKGRVPFAEACKTAGVDPEVVFAKLRPILENVKVDDSAADRMGPTELIDHIVSTHHAFTVDEIHRLVPLSEKVAMRHGDNHPELIEIRDLFNDLAEELIAHQRKDRETAFCLERIDLSRTDLVFALAVHHPLREIPMLFLDRDADGMFR